MLGFEPIQSVAQVYLKGPPMITEPEDGSIIYIDVGSSLLIDCVGVGVPTPHVNWDINMHFGHAVKVHGDHISKSETANQIVTTKSMLSIKEVREEHFMSYNCTAANQYGEITVTLELRIKSMNGKSVHTYGN